MGGLWRNRRPSLVLTHVKEPTYISYCRLNFVDATSTHPVEAHIFGQNRAIYSFAVKVFIHDFVYLQLSAMQPDHNPNIFSCCMAVGKQTFASDSEYLCQMTYLNLPLCGTVTWQHSCERNQFAILEKGHVQSAFILKGAPTICKCSWNCNMKAVERTCILLGVELDTCHQLPEVPTKSTRSRCVWS